MILEKSVGSRFLAQALDFTAIQKNTQLTEWVKLRIFQSAVKPIPCAIIPRPTDHSRMMIYLMSYPDISLKVVVLRALIILVIGFMSVCKTQAQTPVRSHTIEITGFVFTPQTINVKQGDSITWINRDIAPHTATGSDSSWDTGLINKGESKTIVVSSDMDLSYLCIFHPSMKADIVVKSD